MNLDFEVLVKDEVTAHVMVDGSNVKIEKFTNTPYKQPFLHNKTSLEFVLSFLKERAISENKANISEILSELGLERYDTIEILKKTHGVDWDDFMWIRFKGDNTQYKDVRLR